MSEDKLKPLCDFCSSELRFGSTWVFPCRDHVISGGPLRQKSEGDWSACRACKDLIVAGRRDKLMKRGARATLRVAPAGTPAEMAEKVTRDIQDTFWSNRSGPPRIETREEWDEGVKPLRMEPIPPDEAS